MKTLLFSHRDLDGVVAAACYPERATTVFLSYDPKRGEQIKQAILSVRPEHVVFLDLAFREGELDFLGQLKEGLGFSLSLVDHHKTNSAPRDLFDSFQLEEGKCAAELVYEALPSPPPGLEDWVRIARDRDLGENRLVELHRALNFIAAREPNRLKAAISSGHHPAAVLTSFSKLVESSMRRFKRSLKVFNLTSQTYDLPGGKLVVGLVLSTATDVAIELMNGSPRVFALLTVFDDEIAVSFRKQGFEELDLSRVASRFGGGGHAGAAGGKVVGEKISEIGGKIQRAILEELGCSSA